MREIRIFVPQPLVSGTVVSLPPAALQHVVKVLRLRSGAAVTLFDGRGGEYAANLLEVERRSASARVVEYRKIERESPCRITLLQGLARGERMDWVLQKATELGVSRIVPLVTRRSMVQLDEARGQTRLAHWQGVITAACEQCGRNTLPSILPPTSLAAACAGLANETIPAVRWLLSPEASDSLNSAIDRLAPDTTDICVLIGPEGGLEDEEIALAKQSGFGALRLGPRVLRTETAAIAALAALQCLVGDFK